MKVRHLPQQYVCAEVQSSKTSTFLSSRLLKSSLQVSVCESTTCAVAATLSIRLLEGLQGAMPACTRECRDNCIVVRKQHA